MKPLHGFTLLEMVLAMAIFSITVVGLMQGISLTLRSAEFAADAGHVRQQLASRLIEARLKPYATGSATSAPDARGVVYVTAVEPLKLRDRRGRDLRGLFRLRLTASWRGPEGPQTETVEEYVWQPPSPTP